MVGWGRIIDRVVQSLYTIDGGDRLKFNWGWGWGSGWRWGWGRVFFCFGTLAEN
jgi:hypothetical protein